MTKEFDNEIDAIKAVISALEPLTAQARSTVLDYALKRLSINLLNSVSTVTASNSDAALTTAGSSPVTNADQPVTHIKILKEQKKPRSASEMAALVAYYLSSIMSANERKETIKTKDIETYFKIAEFKLPEKVQFTLPNAKAAGYFDAVGNGEYKLNAVGHNLVVHSMPRDSSAEAQRPNRRKAKPKSFRTRQKHK